MRLRRAVTMRTTARAGGVAAFLVLAAGAEASEADLKRMIPDDQPSCFGRVFDPAHLRQDPRQRVTSFRLDFRPVHPEERGRPREAFEFHARVTARRPASETAALGSCFTDAGLFECKLECDAGRFDLSGRGPDRLEVTIKWLSLAGCDQVDNALQGPADRVIRLQRLLPRDCEAVEAWAPAAD